MKEQVKELITYVCYGHEGTLTYFLENQGMYRMEAEQYFGKNECAWDTCKQNAYLAIKFYNRFTATS